MVHLQCIDSLVHAATYAEGNGFVVEQSCGKEGRISETFRHRGYLSLTKLCVTDKDPQGQNV